MKRVGVVLSGCGSGDGSEIQEAVLALLAIERAGAEAVIAAPDLPQARVIDHRTGQPVPDAQPRNALVEAARIARGRIVPLQELLVEQLDALVLPGGEGVAAVLSNYESRGVVCEVNPELVRLLKGCHASRRPMGFICLAPLLAARVLGPVAGVKITLGPRGSAPDKHAAVMGADVRPCAVRDIIVDQKARVVSTPAYMHDDARLMDVAAAIDKLVRTVLSFARDRRPAVAPVAVPARQPSAAPAGRADPATGSRTDPIVRKPDRAATRDRGSA